jgi:hypothetical protein
MSIITDLYATLNTNSGVRAIVGENTSPQQSRIYPEHAPESADVPHIVYRLIAGTEIHTIPGVGDMERQLIQLDCNQSSPELAEALADAVVAALEGNGYIELRINIYSDDTQTYAAIVDWAFLA